MSRVLIYLALGAVAYWLLKSRNGRPAGHAVPADRERPVETMVQCTHCGVHLPRSEGIIAGGKHYCCEAHGRAHQATPQNRNAG
jgi:uncharacterized protein